MAARLNSSNVEKLKDGEFLWDPDLKGFGVRGRSSGQFYVLKTRINGRQRWFTIGRHGAPWKPEKARQQALVMLGQIANGDDPSDERASRKRAMTVAELCDVYLDEGCDHKSESTIATDKGRIERHIKPLLAKRLVQDVSRQDIAMFLRDIAAGKTATDQKTKKQGRAIVRGGRGTASRTVGLLGGIFSFAEDRGLIEQSPVKGIKRYRDKKVERFLSEAELARLGGALSSLEQTGQLSPFAAAAIRLLLFTGARKNEILSLKWSSVDLEREMIFLPDSKTGQKPIFLSGPARAILSELPRMSGNPFVICGSKPGEHLTDLKRPWEKLLKEAGITDLRIHDLRHHFASTGAMGGLSLPMIGRLLGHARAETTARYAHLADDPVRKANDAVATRIADGLLPRKQASS